MTTMEEALGIHRGPVIDFRQFLNNFSKSIKPTILSIDQQDITTLMNSSQQSEEFEKLKKSCSLEKVKSRTTSIIYAQGCTEAYRMKNSQANFANKYKLKTYESLMKAKETAKVNPFSRSEYSFKMVKLPELACNSARNGENVFRDLLISVRIYRPARATHEGQTLEKPVFSDEFKCLGSNFLTEFRDKIPCICNKNRFFDISEDPSNELPQKLSDPGYFFIHDTFYNDKRNPNNADYSETVRNWATTAPGMAQKKFKIADMALTSFLDLKASLGYPYLYLHHGNCEHIYAFSQLEILAPYLVSQIRCQYPYLNSYNVYNNHACHMCGARNYSFIVEQSKRQLYDPSYLCSNCFYGFHYVDGKKFGQFKAYRITNTTATNLNNVDTDDVDESLNSDHEGSDDDTIVIKDEYETDTSLN